MWSKRLLLTAAVFATSFAVCAAAEGAFAADPTIDARVRQTQDPLRPRGQDVDSLITGSGDLILLAPTKIVTFRLEVSPQWTDNAQLSPTDGRDDFIVTGEAALGLAIRVAGRYDLHSEVGLLTADYRRDSSLDYSAVTGNLGIDAGWVTRAGFLNLGAAYAPAVIYDSGFGSRQLTQHRILATTQLNTMLRRSSPGGGGAVLLVSSALADRTWADPSDYDNWSASIDETLIVAATARVWFSVGGGYYIRRYDDYFSGLIGTDRRDHGWRASAGVDMALSPMLTASLRFSHTDNRSTSDVNLYAVSGGGLTLRFARRF